MVPMVMSVQDVVRLHTQCVQLGSHGPCLRGVHDRRLAAGFSQQPHIIVLCCPRVWQELQKLPVHAEGQQSIVSRTTFLQFRVCMPAHISIRPCAGMLARLDDAQRRSQLLLRAGDAPKGSPHGRRPGRWKVVRRRPSRLQASDFAAGCSGGVWQRAPLTAIWRPTAVRRKVTTRCADANPSLKDVKSIKGELSSIG